jgi:hypothetical protein
MKKPNKTPPKKFVVVEVGSTNTKALLYDGGEIVTLPQITIEFKGNFRAAGGLLDTDVALLCGHVNDLKNKTPEVYVYGTSIFRELPDEQRGGFLREFKAQTGLDFNVVTPEQESNYTVAGVVLGNAYRGRLAVMIAGGGSTEVCIVENKKIIERTFNGYGAISVTHQFPQINDLHPGLTMREVDRWCAAQTAKIKNKAEVLVIAGGDFILFYEMAGADLIGANSLYKDDLQPYSISMADSKRIDRRCVFREDVREYQRKRPDYKAWWLGTRGMRFCVRAVAARCGTKTIIPTRINMCMGIIKEKINKF